MKGIRTPNIAKHIKNRYLRCLWRAKWLLLGFWLLLVTVVFTWSELHGWKAASLALALVNATLMLGTALFEAWVDMEDMS